MKNPTIFRAFVTLFFLSSCSFIAGIFQAGMGFGIFMVLLVIAMIFLVIMRAGKK